MLTVCVIVPVYRGASVLRRAADSLQTQWLDRSTTMHVVLAVNDGLALSLETAAEAVAAVRRAGHTADLVESRVGRAAAFNAAEAILPRGPRLYLDQDAALSPGSIQALATALGEGSGVHFAVPHLHLGRSANLLPRWYYTAWQAVPYVRDSPVTVGAYAVSAQGRNRWASFPELHSDDKWVRLHFTPQERRVVDGSYEVVPPSTLPDLLRSRRRYLRGNAELKRVAPWTRQVDRTRYAGVCRALLTRPRLWAPAAVLAGVSVTAQALEGGWRVDPG